MCVLSTLGHAMTLFACCAAPALTPQGDHSDEDKVQVARRLVELADREANGIKDRAGAYESAAMLFVSAGDHASALAAISKAEATHDRLSADTNSSIADAYVQILRRLKLAESRYACEDRRAGAEGLKRLLAWLIAKDEPFSQKLQHIVRIVRTAKLCGDSKCAVELLATVHAALASLDDDERAQVPQTFFMQLLVANGSYRRVFDAVVSGQPQRGLSAEDYKLTTLSELARVADLRDGAELATILDEALPLVYGITNPGQRTYLLITFANAQTRLKRFDQSKTILESVSVESVPEESEELIRHEKAIALATLSESLAKADNRADAIGLLSEAIELSVGATGQSAASLRLRIRFTCASMGESEQILSNVETLTKDEQFSAKMTCAWSLLQRGDLETARPILEQLKTDALAALEAATREPAKEAGTSPQLNPVEMAKGRLGVILAMCGDFDGADKTLAGIETPFIKRGSYGAIARSALARRGLDGILAWIDAHQDPEIRFSALSALANTMVDPDFLL